MIATNAKALAPTLIKKLLSRVVPVVELRIDETYQRGVKTYLVADIVAHFNEEALGALLVAKRKDGSLWIVDGQQRFEAVKQLGWNEIRCDVFTSSGAVHEAEIYTLVNLKRRKLSSRDEFKALLAKNDPAARAVLAAVEEIKWRVTLDTQAKRTPRDVKAVNTLLHILKRRGAPNLKLTLSTINKAWPGDPQMTFATLLDGVSIFLKRMEASKWNYKLFLGKLRSVTAREVIYSAQFIIPAKSGESTRSAAVADVLAKLQRKRTRKPSK